MAGIASGAVESSILLVAGSSDRSNSAVRRRNGGFPCRIWAPTVRRDKINRWNCLERNFVGVRVGCSQSAMLVLTQNVFGTIQAITEKIGHFSASRPNSRGKRNPQPVGGERADDRSNRRSREPVWCKGFQSRIHVWVRIADPIWASGRAAAPTDPMRASGGAAYCVHR